MDADPCPLGCGLSGLHSTLDCATRRGAPYEGDAGGACAALRREVARLREEASRPLVLTPVCAWCNAKLESVEAMREHGSVCEQSPWRARFALLRKERDAAVADIAHTDALLEDRQRRVSDLEEALGHALHRWARELWGDGGNWTEESYLRLRAVQMGATIREAATAALAAEGKEERDE